jgi:MFS family permease
MLKKADRSDPLSRKIVLLATSTMTIMAGATIAPSLPAIQNAFSGLANVKTLVPLILTTPALFIAFTAPVIGMLVDKLGRKLLLVLSLVVYGLAGTTGLYLKSLTSIIAGRALLGIAVAGVMTCVTTLITDYYTGPDRAKFMGIQSSFMALGGVFFLVFGGLLADIHWRLPFAIYFFSLVMLVPVIIWINEPKLQTRTAAGPDTSSREPIPWRPVLKVYSLAFAGMAMLYTIPVHLPFYLRQLMGASGAGAGIAISFSTLFSALAGMFFPRIRQRYNHRQIFTILLPLVGVGFVILAFAANYPLILMATAVSGFGFGLMMPNINVRLAGLAPEWARGRIIGGSNTCIFLGQFFSPLLAGPIIAENGFDGILGLYSIAGMAALLLGATIAARIGGRLVRAGEWLRTRAGITAHT